MSTYQYRLNAYNKKHLGEYNRTMNNYSSTVDNYRRYVAPLDVPDMPKVEIDKERVDNISSILDDYIKRRHSSYLNIDNKRSNLDRVFDALQVGQYVTMGGLLGAVDEELTVWEGMTQGLRASNPLGDGRDKWEYSFSDVLGSMGWNPESTGGKIAKGAVGIVGDIFLDPLTYVSGGLMAGVKGTGQASAKLATKGNKILDLLGDASKFIDNVDELKDVTHMTQEMAEAIIKNSNVVKSGIVGVDVAKDAERLARQYNKLLGVQEAGDIVFSLGNAPFGKKIFGGFADKQYTIMTDKAFRQFGDATIAPVYARIRDAVYGGKIGKLFSSTHSLYKLAGTNPESVYNSMKTLDHYIATNKEKTKALAEIRKYADEIMGLTPKEADEVIKVMQDKSKWAPIQKHIRFMETKEAKEYRDKIVKMRDRDQALLEKWTTEPVEWKAKRLELSGELHDKEKALQAIYDERIAELAEFNTNHLLTKQDYEAYLKELESIRLYTETKRVDFEVDAFENLAKQYDAYKGRNLANLETRKLGDDELGQKVKQAQKDLREILTKESFSSDSTYRKARKELVDKGYIEYKRASKFSDSMEQSLGDGWEKVVKSDGSIQYHPPKEIKDTVSGLQRRSYDDFQLDKQQFIDELNVTLFGDKGYIHPEVWDSAVDDLVRYMKTHTKEETIEFILLRKDMYSGKTPIIYKFIGEQIGYGKRSKFKSWEEYYNGQMRELFERNFDKVPQEDVKNIKSYKDRLSDRLKDKVFESNSEDLYKFANDFDITETDRKKLVDLQKKMVERKLLQDVLNDAKTMDEAETIISAIATKEVEQYNFVLDEAWGEHRKLYSMADAKAGVSDIDYTLTTRERDIAKKYLLDKDMAMRKDYAVDNAKYSDDASVKVLYDSYTQSKDEITRYRNMIDLKKKQIKDMESKVHLWREVEDMGRVTETHLRINKLNSELTNLQKSLQDEVSRSKGYYDEVMKAVSSKTGTPSDATLRYYDEVVDEFDRLLKEKRVLFGELDEAPKSGQYAVDTSYDRISLYTEAQRRVNARRHASGIDDYNKHLADIRKEESISRKERLAKAIERADGKSIADVKAEEHKKNVQKLIDDLKARKQDKLNKLAEDLKEINPSIQYDLPKPKSATKAVDTASDVQKGYPMDLYELYDNQEYIDVFVKRSDELMEGFARSYEIEYTGENLGVLDQIKNVKKKIADIDDEAVRKRGELIARLNDRSRGLEDETLALGRQIRNLGNLEAQVNPKRIEDLTRRINRYNRALSNDNAFINFLYTNKPMFDGLPTRSEMDTLMKTYNATAGEYILDPDLDITDRAREIAEGMRNAFREMGVWEVEINKLLEGQYDANFMDYLPHILTREGEMLFKDPEIVKKMQGFGNVQGFGTEFNNFAKSRTLKIPDEYGGMIDKPTIEQINKFFEPFTGGKPVMETDLSEIYLARAQKHTDLMYDHKYMDNMIELFGKEYSGELIENHKLTANYGHMKERMLDYVSRSVNLDMSDDISAHVANPKIMESIKAEASRIVTKSKGAMTYAEAQDLAYEMEVSRYVKANWSPEAKKILREKRLLEYTEATGTKGMLGDMSMPLLELGDEHVDGIKGIKGTIMRRYEDKIRSGFEKFFYEEKTQKLLLGDLYKIDLNEVPLAERGRIKAMISNIRNINIEEMSLGDIRKKYQEIAQYADNSTYKRIQRGIKRIDDAVELQINGDLKVGQMATHTVDKMNQSRKLQIMKDNNDMLQVYDKFLHFIKVNQTAIMPGFHTRNKWANDFNNYLAVGTDAYDIKLQTDIIDAMKFKAGKDGVVDKAIDIVDKNGNKSKMLLSELLQVAEDYGVTNKGVFAIDLGTELESGGLFKKFLPGKFDPTDMTNFIAYRKGTQLGSAVENHDRLVHFIALVRRGEDYSSAAESVNKFMFDYSDLTMFEASVMKRILPYYTWLRKNGPLQLEQVLEQPEKYRNIAKVLGGVRGMVDAEDRINKAFVNDFALDWIQTPFTATNPQGREEPILWNPNLPFMDISRLPDLSDPAGSARDLFTQMSPILKTPIELATNRNYFFDSPIAKDDENRFTKSIGHVASQMAVVPAMEGFIQKKGLDRVLHGLNTTSGLKFLSYDYETYKAMKIQEILKSGNKKRPNIVGDVAKSITKGFADAISYAGSQIKDEARGVAQTINEGKPMGADEYLGALRPISQKTFDSLDPDEQAKYIPPTMEDGAYIHQRAQELSEQAYQESGAVKKFVWALLDSTILSDDADQYKMGRVAEVKDGDTFTVELGGKKQDVRVLLVDTPETGKDFNGTDDMPFGQEATNYGKDALFDKDVKLYFDGEDHYGRMLAFVEVDGQDYGEGLLEEGMAQYRFDYGQDYARKPAYLDAEMSASKSGKGIWSLQGYATPNLDDDYNMNIDMTGYNNFKEKKFREILNKKDTVNTNPSGWDNVLQRLR